jgi:hypothetical protein
MLIFLHFLFEVFTAGLRRWERKKGNLLVVLSAGSRKKVGILAAYFALVLCYNSFRFRSLSITNAVP